MITLRGPVLAYRAVEPPPGKQIDLTKDSPKRYYTRSCADVAAESAQRDKTLEAGGRSKAWSFTGSPGVMGPLELCITQ